MQWIDKSNLIFHKLNKRKQLNFNQKQLFFAEFLPYIDYDIAISSLNMKKMKRWVLRHLYCFQSSIQFEKKSIYDLHLSNDHDCKTRTNKTEDWSLVQHAASAGVKVKLGLFR